jgi:NADH-quinone oxidoreductase subunit H
MLMFVINNYMQLIPLITISSDWHMSPKALITIITFKQLIKIVLLLIAVAYFTLAERKVMAGIQRRKGPNVVGFWGLLQPLADGAKLIFKELLVPTRADSQIFLLAPILIFILSIINWSVIPLGVDIKQITTIGAEYESTSLSTIANISYGLLFMLALSGFNVYGIIIAGWSSNSKYAFLGALRSAAQMISYEVALGLLLLPVILLSGSLNFGAIVTSQEKTGWNILPLLPCGIMFFISMLAETNRAPFDLPEAEAELVAGYNVEYSSIIFAMFFLGEYTNMLLMSTVIVLFFFGGWLPIISSINLDPAFWFSLKIIIFCFLFILVRAGLPRYRYDQLMTIGWKIFLPIALSYLMILIPTLLLFDALPQVSEIGLREYKESILI